MILDGSAVKVAHFSPTTNTLRWLDRNKADLSDSMLENAEFYEDTSLVFQGIFQNECAR